MADVNINLGLDTTGIAKGLEEVRKAFSEQGDIGLSGVFGQLPEFSAAAKNLSKSFEQIFDLLETASSQTIHLNIELTSNTNNTIRKINEMYRNIAECFGNMAEGIDTSTDAVKKATVVRCFFSNFHFLFFRETSLIKCKSYSTT